MQKKINIAMAGGGTGGHIFPVQSLIDFLDEKKEIYTNVHHVYWFGSKKNLEYQIYKSTHIQHCTLDFISVLSGKRRRETFLRSRIRNIRDLFLFFAGIFQSLFRIIFHKIDVIFCKGGYVALPVVIAGWILRKKIIVHESDTHAGLVNRIASRFAHKTFVGFSGSLPKAERVGQIISDKILVESQKKTTKIHEQNTLFATKNKFNHILSLIDRKKTTCLVTGGSQGSQKLYMALKGVLEKNKHIQQQMNFLIVLGERNQELKKEFKKFPYVQTFDMVTQQEMGQLLDISDIALTRAGVTSLAEQKLYDLRIIMIPIPWTHDQYDNAKWYVEHYQDILLDQKGKEYLGNMKKLLNQHVGYKKTVMKKDRKKEIIATKEKIWKAILG